MSLSTFKSLGVSEETVAILTKKGYQTPTPIQSALIPVFFESDQDIIGKADTGTGKTGAFGIPLIDTIESNKKGVQAIAIAPTRELASQVAKELTIYKGRRRIDIIELCGGQGMKQQIDQLKRIKQPTIIVGTPGRILDHLMKKRLHLKDISYLIIDEVDVFFNEDFLGQTCTPGATLRGLDGKPIPCVHNIIRYIWNETITSISSDGKIISESNVSWYNLIDTDEYKDCIN